MNLDPTRPPEPFDIAPEIIEALASGRGVVALESTLISHGLPRPANLETAIASESAVRSAGALPATVAVIGGRIRVGLSAADLERIAGSSSTIKAGRRDLARAVAQRLDAATTVSATLWIARRAGITAMATGGLGGVHREAGSTFDVSTDLDELAAAAGALVVCSGFKSILDLPATLQMLETLGVPVVGFGTTDLPGFTARSTGLPLTARVDTLAEAAALWQAHRTLGLPGAIVLANPAPADSALDRDESDASLAVALAHARSRGITGPAVTPFLLEEIRQATGGRSLHANRALIVANARLAGEVASALVGPPPA